MPTEIIKPERDVDFYVAWSSIVDAPTMFGPREWMLQHVKGEPGNSPADRLNRADRTGTSGVGGWGCDYDCESLVYQGQGILPRSSLPALCERLEVDENADMSDLLMPFEDSEASGE